MDLETARVPDGVRLYAVGDLHGRCDLLREMHRLIREDAAGSPPGFRRMVVYLGDYVDRGLHSREVIDLLLNEPLEGFDAQHLRGNHDELFLTFLDNPACGDAWFRFGGDATVYSYGVRVPEGVAPGQRMAHIQQSLNEAIPARHRRFLDGLKLTWVIGDYLFVHAGVNPGKPLDRQRPEDVMWIRDEFLDSETRLGKVVVHGHSIAPRPDVRANRIGIDTGAYHSNVLTCLVLEGNGRRFLQTSGD